MPNYCNYVLKIVADEKDKIEEFEKWLKADYSYADGQVKCNVAHHFCRVFEVYPYFTTPQPTEDNWYNIYCGDCAWSVNTCMTENGYYKDLKGTYGSKSKATNLRRVSKLFHCQIEVYSQEPGCAFAEHLIYDNGELITDDTRDCNSYDISLYETREEAEEGLEVDIPQSVWDRCDSDWLTICDYDIADPEWNI